MSGTTNKRTTKLRDALREVPGVAGKVPPQAVDMEEAVLGALMLDKNAIALVIDLLKPETFYHDAHQLIFQAIRNLVDRTSPVDILTVTAELRTMGILDSVGGAYYITRLTNRVSSAAHIEEHSHVIVQKYLMREMIRICTVGLGLGFDETTDVFELFDRVDKELLNARIGNVKKNYIVLSDAINTTIKKIESIKDRKDGLTGVPSGLFKLDQYTGGWQNSDLIIIAARPGMGKTAFVLSVARNAAVDFGTGVAIFSLEMSTVQLTTRLISAESELNSERLRRGDLHDYQWSQLNTRIRKLSDAPIYIDDTPALAVFDLKAKCRRLKANQNVGLIIVDYLQLMRGDEGSRAGNREQEISYISQSLKALAKDLDVPVIALSQLSREVEKTPDKRPLLSHLRESGSIEQDADVVGFIYRPEYYDIMQDAEGNDLSGVAEIIIAKHRNGSTGTVETRFISQFAKFTDMDYSGFSTQGYDPGINPDARIESQKEDLPF